MRLNNILRSYGISPCDTDLHAQVGHHKADACWFIVNGERIGSHPPFVGKKETRSIVVDTLGRCLQRAP